MSQESRSGDTFVVAVCDRDGLPAGLGVQVSQTEVLTCAHVVNRALARLDDFSAPPQLPVRCGWPLLDGNPKVAAQVRDWEPLSEGDLATLVLIGPAPAGATVARLDEASPDPAAQLEVFGYPQGRPRGQRTQVRVVGAVEGGLWQLNTADDALPSVRAGYSGSPVHDAVTGAVVAVVAQAPTGGTARDCLAIPAAKLRAFLPEAPAEPGVGASTAGRAGRVRPERSYAPAPELTVLHLSDPQFGRNHRDVAGLTAADRDHDGLFARLHEDLGKLADGQGLWPDLVVVTGDLTQRGVPSEFARAMEFLERLVEAVGLPRYRVAFVPGNHDLNRKACSAYFDDQKADEREPRPPYWPKWRHSTAAFDRFYAGVTPPGGVGGPEFTPERPWS